MFFPDIKPPTKAETERSDKKQRAIGVYRDIERIDAALAEDDYQALRELHVELDGTYQNVIKNWGASMIGFFKEYGFNYQFLDEDSIRDNLSTMRGKLRGYMLQLDPNIEHIAQAKRSERKEDPPAMTSIYQKLLSDYEKIREISGNERMFLVQGRDYPLFRDTLGYLERYEYLTTMNINSGDAHCYIKSEAFDAFPEHMKARIGEEERTMVAVDSKKVFIVHGHDHALLGEVEMMLRRIGLEPIILMNQVNAGRTIIDKIEEYTNVGFGIVLYTGCDEGRKKGSDTLSDRARQNVVFEHGYLWAKLGRSRVAALNDDGVEVPSDLSGVLYIPHSASNWKQQLMREMKAAGLVFDALNA